MMRRLFFFAFGLLLGSWCVISFAAPTAAGSRINLNLTPSAPSGVTLSGAWDAVVPGLEDTGYGGYRPGTAGAGSAEIYRGVATRVDGVPLALEAKRGITARNLAKGALNFAKRGGPVGLIRGALVGAGLQWATDQWLKQQRPDGAPNVIQPGGDYYTDANSCTRLGPEQSGVNLFSNGSHAIFTVTYGDLQASGFVLLNYCVNYPFGSGGLRPGLWRKTVSAPYVDQLETVPATDQDLEDLLTDNLVDGDLTPEQALKELVEQGNSADGDALNGYLEPVQGSGPSSLPGGTSTSVSSSPAGQTTTTTSTGYDIVYGPAGAVGITKNQTTSTTTPDGQTTTTENTETPANGQNNKPSDEKPLCELFPDASGCEKLGDPGEEPDIEEREVDIPGLDYASVTGTCPAPIAIANRFGSWELSYQPVCTAAEFLRPVIILAALLTAGMYVFVTMRAST